MIFRPDLAQAVMDGRKTVTRRLVPDEAELLSWAAEESAPYLNTEGERRRLRLADRKLIPLLPDPAPQEAE